MMQLKTAASSGRSCWAPVLPTRLLRKARAANQPARGSDLLMATALHPTWARAM